MTTSNKSIDALVELLQSAIPDSTVNDGPSPGYDSSVDSMYTDISVGWSPDSDSGVAELAREGMGGRARESYDIRCTINAYTGEMGMKAARDRAYDVYRECAMSIKSTKTLGVDGVLRAQPSLVSYQAANTDRKGVLATIIFTVTVDGFAEY